MMKKKNTNTVYSICRFAYRKLSLNRFVFFRKLVMRFVAFLLTEEYKLEIKLEELSPILYSDGTWSLIETATVTSGSRLITKNKKAFVPILQNNQLWKELKKYKLQEEAQIALRMDYKNKKVFF